MAILARYTIKSIEKKDYTVKYGQWLGGDEELDGVEVEVTPTTEPPFVVEAVALVPESSVLLNVGPGGIDGTEYTVSIIIETTAPQIKADCILFDVVDEC